MAHSKAKAPKYVYGVVRASAKARSDARRRSGGGSATGPPESGGASGPRPGTLPPDRWSIEPVPGGSMLHRSHWGTFA